MTARHALATPFRLAAVYAFVCAAWATFAAWAAPNMFTRLRHQPGWSFLDRAFQGHEPAAVGDGLWRSIAAAGLIVLVLHMAIVLLIVRWRRLDPPAEDRPSRFAADENLVLILFSALFLLTTAVTWIQGDYSFYLLEWRSVLAGHNPWPSTSPPFNAYGPLFNLLAAPVLLSPLANKLIFAFAYISFVLWLTRKCASSRLDEPPPWVVLGLLILNPFPWEQIAYAGYFDVLVGLACVAALHGFRSRKESLSGAMLSLGVLLKFLPAVILPFLAFGGGRFNRRLVGVCLASVALGLLASLMMWGPSTFTPLAFAATRNPEWSIYSVANSAHTSFNLIPRKVDFLWLETPLMLASLTLLFIFFMSDRRNIAIYACSSVLTTLLFYREGYANYQMLLYCLLAYFIYSEWRAHSAYPYISRLSILYFGFMAICDFDFWQASWRPIFHPNTMIVLKFFLGCLLLAELLRMAFTPARPGEDRGASRALA